MSRIGKRPIPVADGVQVQYTDREYARRSLNWFC